MYQGEEYDKIKQSAKDENFVYDLTSQRHDVEKLFKMISDAFLQADMIETRFCINTNQKKGEINDWYYANSEAFDKLKKSYYSLKNDLRRLNK